MFAKKSTKKKSEVADYPLDLEVEDRNNSYKTLDGTNPQPKLNKSYTTVLFPP